MAEPVSFQVEPVNLREILAGTLGRQPRDGRVDGRHLREERCEPREPGPAAEVKRWSAARKKEMILRLLRGEPVDAVSREVAC